MTPRPGAMRHPTIAREVLTVSALAALLAGPAGADGRWHLVSAPPTWRWASVSVVDTVNDVLYLYGGGRESLGDRYTSAWTSWLPETFGLWAVDLASGAARPVPTSGPAPHWSGDSRRALFDAERNQLIFMGCLPQTRSPRDIWFLSLSTMEWSHPVYASGPVGGYGSMPGFVLDAARDRLLVWGGSAGDSLWSLSLTGGGWEYLEPAAPHPPALSRHVAVFDPVRDRMIVHGAGGVYTTTWELTFDPEPVWRDLQVGLQTPVSTHDAHAYYDAAGDQIVMAGQMMNTTMDPERSVAANEITAFVLSGPLANTWQFLRPFNRVPAEVDPLWKPAITFDPRRRCFVSLGGAQIWYCWAEDGVGDCYAVSTPAMHTFSLAGPWQWEPVQLGFPAIANPAAAYDPSRQRLLVVGGANRTYEILLEGAAEDGVREIASLEGQLPAPLNGHRVVVDVAGDRLILIGAFFGAGGQLVLMSMPLGGEPRWSPLVAAGTPPGPRTGASAVYDPTGHRMIVFGGDSLGVYKNETFVLSLAGTPTWTRLPGGGPWARSGHVAVYDPQGDRMIVHGGRSGNSLRNDTWQLSLSGTPEWSFVPAGDFPAIVPRTDAAAALDVARHRLLVFGGRTNSVTLNDLWELPLDTEEGWLQVTPDPGAAPATRRRAAGVYDPGNARFWVLGGEDGSGQPIAEAWTFTNPSLLDAGGGRDRPLAFDGARPNPTRGPVSLEFTLPAAGEARLEVFDVGGRRVRAHAPRRFEAGRSSIVWDARDDAGERLGPGLYFCRLEAGGARFTRRVVVTR